jgi:phage shock protein C
MQVNRRLYRCRHNRVIAGVASGMAEFFDIDPTIVRVLWVLSVFFGGLGLLAYIVMAIIMPLEPEEGLAMAPAGEPGGEAPVPSSSGWHAPLATHRQASRDNGRLVTFLGIALILFGAIALINLFLPDWADGGRFIWPAFILGIGVLLVASAVRRDPTPP